MAGTFEGSVVLFNSAKQLKTKSVVGNIAMVSYLNGQIVAAASYGKLTILNKDLRVIRCDVRWTRL